MTKIDQNNNFNIEVNEDLQTATLSSKAGIISAKAKSIRIKSVQNVVRNSRNL